MLLGVLLWGISTSSVWACKCASWDTPKEWAADALKRQEEIILVEVKDIRDSAFRAEWQAQVIKDRKFIERGMIDGGGRASVHVIHSWQGKLSGAIELKWDRFSNCGLRATSTDKILISFNPQYPVSGCTAHRLEDAQERIAALNSMTGKIYKLDTSEEKK